MKHRWSSPRWVAALLSAAIVALLVLGLPGGLFRNGPSEIDSLPEETVESSISSSERAEQLRALPYLQNHPVRQGDSLEEGVLQNDSDRTFRGANLFCAQDSTIGRLIDMEGTELHTWSTEGGGGEHLEIDSEGNLIATGESALTKISWDSQVVWRIEGTFHHDVAPAPDGTLYALSRRSREVPWDSTRLPILDDLLLAIGPTGEILSTVSLWDLFGKEVSDARMTKIASLVDLGRGPEDPLLQDFCDVLHTNSVQYIERDVPGFARRGDILLSVREIDTIALVRLEVPTVVWSWGAGELHRQHHATLLEDGEILLFDNRRQRSGSRILQLDPETKEIVWEYEGESPSEFYSQRGGSCQRLPNGNTLIAETDRGRVFEITSDGTPVWEFRSKTTRAKARGIVRASVYRMTRIYGSTLRTLPFDQTTHDRLEREGYFSNLDPVAPSDESIGRN